MFPLDTCTAHLQSAVEAEYDVGALIVAMRAAPEVIRPVVMKYVITAELSFIDALEAVFTKGKGGFWQRFARTSFGDGVRTGRKDFETLKSSLTPVLRNTVRNRGAAHKDHYFVETEAEMMRALNSTEPARLFNMARRLVDTLAGNPVWTWGYSRSGGGICGVLAGCARPIDHGVVHGVADAFGTRGYTRLTPEVLVEEREFESLQAATAWAESLDYEQIMALDGEPSNTALNPTGADAPAG